MSAFSDGPSSAPLFRSPADEFAGWPSRELGIDPSIRVPGSHQFLGHQAEHHEDRQIASPNANRVLPGTLPKSSGPAIGAADHVNPLGRQFSASLESS